MPKTKVCKHKKYKLKTHSGAKKRFKFTKNDNVVKAHANKNHILTKKVKKRKRHLKGTNLTDKTNVAQIKALLPNH